MNKKVTDYLNGLTQWKEELSRLREIILDCNLVEDFKWMHPCYTFKGKNIVLLHGFKEYSALLFYKGALLKDPKKILIQQTENVQTGRQIRFINLEEINQLEVVIKSYILEAVEHEKTGRKIPMKKVTDFAFPAELKQKFKENRELETAFNNLTPGRKKGYLLHFSQAKQSSTRLTRIEKNTKRIFDGKGLNDCICGLSKRMPNCDSSHNQLSSK
ncbi:Uncharacterized conserved protein YdeI, YjbR/CyaY-like superfamily, DUF1801 family [Maribacter orientalis]|uniref:Uncharacterized conserved protein YdeI, YjbR/CyaY-like superfamily, DUF1801 family n=1 Tax=Maribacter orientalis TaxID=228957 RepID=A0A1H7RG66_9FLAO|nr:DUF1801 domain-containing protein [Maribacter orientalis]SEL59008.1 Uncharacterized conserved protein YdeI, YjbR/CyaY-like superfamily, DUF1801 family [Maribacter orientalis]